MLNKIKEIFIKDNKHQNKSELISIKSSEIIKDTSDDALNVLDNKVDKDDNLQRDKINTNKQTTFEEKIAKEKKKHEWIKNIEKNLDFKQTTLNKNPINGKSEVENYNTVLNEDKENIYNGEAINFSCTKCGQCCNVPPKVEFNELLKLKDEFIFQTNHTCFLSYNKNPLPKEITDFYNGIGHTIVLTDLEAVMFYFIEFTPMINPSYKRCPKLVDNLCSIYEKRPHSCELYPFSKSYEQEEQWRSINFFKNKTKEGLYKCDFSSNSPIIYDDYMFNDYSLENRFEKSIDDIHNFTNYYISFLEKLGGKEYKNNHFKYLVNAISQKSLFISDTLNPMLTGVMNNLVTKEEAENFVLSQIILIEKEIDNSKCNKNKENLHTTRLYSKQLSMFKKALDTNMFDLSKYHNK